MRSDPEQMRAAARRMAALADGFWDDVESLRREADAVMGGEWTGEAASSHSALWAEWVDSARQVAGALTEDAGLLDRTATAYERVEDVNVVSISEARVSMDL